MRPKDNKILLALQFWEGDKGQAMELAKFIADLEPVHNNLADVLFVCRFDSGHDLATVQHVSRKFNTYTWKSRRRGVGWPDGCNELWFSTMEWVHGMIQAKRVPNYKSVFTFEADCAPMTPDWVARMSAIWDRVNQPNPVVMAGALIPDNGPHINGNAMMSCDPHFTTWLTKRLGGVHPGCGWDFILAKEFQQRGWADVPEMKSFYNTRNYTPAQYIEMVNRGLVWIHGVKDLSLIRMGRERMLKKIHVG
jgi:hypothetical protein